MEYWIDQLVAGYRVRALLREDSTGVLYRAFHTTHRTDVVLHALADFPSQHAEIMALGSCLVTLETEQLWPGNWQGCWVQLQLELP